MKEVKIEKCQFCGGTIFGNGFQISQGCIMTGHTGLKGSKVTHLICKTCGSIIHSKVEKPEMFELK
jgi:hypothetical protein